jgi:hypothetical protein
MSANRSPNSYANLWFFLKFPRFQWKNLSERKSIQDNRYNNHIWIDNLIYMQIIDLLACGSVIWFETKVSKQHWYFYVIFRTKTKFCQSDPFEDNWGVCITWTTQYIIKIQYLINEQFSFVNLFHNHSRKMNVSRRMKTEEGMSGWNLLKTYSDINEYAWRFFKSVRNASVRICVSCVTIPINLKVKFSSGLAVAWSSLQTTFSCGFKWWQYIQEVMHNLLNREKSILYLFIWIFKQILYVICRDFYCCRNFVTAFECWAMKDIDNITVHVIRLKINYLLQNMNKKWRIMKFSEINFLWFDTSQTSG